MSRSVRTGRDRGGTVLAVSALPRRARSARPDAARYSAGTPFELDESKLHPAPSRPGIVVRAALVDRLVGARHPVVAVTAPAGYGKTTVLAQLAERKQTGVAWLSLDDRDNDPTVLLTYLAVALQRVESIQLPEFRGSAAPDAGIADVLRLVSAIRSMANPVYIVL